MALNLANLDETTRQFMLEEIEYDIAQNKLHYSPRLSAAGKQLYPDMLRRAARKGTNLTLAGELRVPGRLNKTEERKTPKGATAVAQVPVTAADTLAEDEFSRFYARGLCRRAEAQGVDTLVVYRAREVINPHPESAELIGRSLSAKQFLEYLRDSADTDAALGLPPGPHSGLSVKLPEAASGAEPGMAEKD